MHEQFPLHSLHSKQIDVLEPQSRSSLDIGNTPVLQNHFYQQMEQFNDHSIPIVFTNEHLHDLVTVQQKIYEPEAKQMIQKYISMVMHLNNIAHFFICKLQNKQKKSGEISDNGKQGPDLNKKDQSQISLSPYPYNSSSNSDKLQLEILMMLNEAERILEYAASCGKIIDRKLIISVLNNQACFYQKIWQLQKSCTYVEAAIINMEQWGQESNWSQISSSNSVTVNSVYSNHPIFITKVGFPNIEEDIILANMRRERLPKSQGQFSTRAQLNGNEDRDKLAKNYQLISSSTKRGRQSILSPILDESLKKQGSSLQKKQIQAVHHMKKLFELSVYYLQYTSLCGQLNFHDRAIETSKKVIGKIKKILLLNRKHYINVEQNKSEHVPHSFIISEQNLSYDESIEIDRKKMIIGLSEIDDHIEEVNENMIENFRQAARFYLKQYQLVHNYGSKTGSLNEKSKQKKVTTDKNKKLTRLHKTLTGLEFEDNAQKYTKKGYKYEDYIEMVKIKAEIKNFTISDILQIKSKNYKYWPLDESKIDEEPSLHINKQNQHDSRAKPKFQTRKQKNSIFKYLPEYLFNPASRSEENTLIHAIKNDNLLFNFENIATHEFPFLFTIALLYATSYFVLATQLRLQAAKDEVKQGDRFDKQIYKESEIYHLTAILILVIYVPLDMSYLRHIVASYQNYYVHQISPIDDNMGNDYGNGPKREQNMSYSNIVLRNKFDKQGIYKYPKIESKKQKQIMNCMKKVIHRQTFIESKSEDTSICVPQLSKRNTLNGLNNAKEISIRVQQSPHKPSKDARISRRQKFEDSEEDYSNSQDKIYESLFDLQKRKKLKEKSTHQRRQSKSNSEKKDQKRYKTQTCYQMSGEAYGRGNNCRLESKREEDLFQRQGICKKGYRRSDGNRKMVKVKNTRIHYFTAVHSPQKLLHANELRKPQLSTPKNNSVKYKNQKSTRRYIQGKNMIHKISHSISVIPKGQSTHNIVRLPTTSKNSLLEKNPIELVGDRSKRKKKSSRSKEIIYSSKNKINEYRLNSNQRARKKNRKTTQGTKEKGQASKSKSDDKFRKRLSNGNNPMLESLEKKQSPQNGNHLDKNPETYREIKFNLEAEDSSDPDIYRINVNKNQKNQKKLKKLKEKKGGGRLGSVSSNKGTGLQKPCKQSPKVTAYSSNLTTTTPSNSIGVKNSNRKILNPN